jgi:hypothetical protein
MTEGKPERRENLQLRQKIEDYEREAHNAFALAKTTKDESQRLKLLDIAEALTALVARLKERAREAPKDNDSTS